VFSEGDGIYLKDVDDNVYMNLADLNVSVGHGNQKIVEAVES
jgi:4-aminobutyrate aminotransferase-like enzyme